MSLEMSMLGNTLGKKKAVVSLALFHSALWKKNTSQGTSEGFTVSCSLLTTKAFPNHFSCIPQKYFLGTENNVWACFCLIPQIFNQF